MPYSSNPYRALLRPLSVLYGWGVALRHFCFDRGILPQVSYPIPVICVGNIIAGGTGKTPHVEYLIRLLGERRRVALISRGYKRKSRGMIIASSSSSVADIGDEPKQILTKYPNIRLVVDGNRRRAMAYFMSLPEDERPEVVIMDDGYQHRYVRPSFSILLIDAARHPKDDHLLPEGLLREPLEQIHRADCVIISKCPANMSSIERRIIDRGLRLYPHQQLFFSRMQPKALCPVLSLGAETVQGRGSAPMLGDRVMALAGIAQGETFVRQLSQSYSVVQSYCFADHHNYRGEDLARLEQAFAELSAEQADKPLWCICTEKDAVRLYEHRSLLSSALLEHLYYQPIEVKLLQRQEVFDRLILSKARPLR